MRSQAISFDNLEIAVYYLCTNWKTRGVRHVFGRYLAELIPKCMAVKDWPNKCAGSVYQ